MTDSNSTKELEKKLLSFITEEDPMLCMLQWITEKFMEIEVANKVGAQKGKHSAERTTHLSGSRVRRFDTRMGTMYLTIPKLLLLIFYNSPMGVKTFSWTFEGAGNVFI
ncbi:transposase [uncultured Sphaerochaeta sp.]|uniref:transposase n=1 Tax=uncultured Sphaerochaeta sp. TaxID=886478 RepID=UPI002A0A7BBD|nr:transposase [uncultured Sphaerochaeta sp.]